MEDKPTTASAPRKMNYHFAPNNAHIVELMKLTAATPKELAETFGVSVGSINTWLRHGDKVPKWTLIACEGIRRRFGKRGAMRLAIVKLPCDKVETATAVIAALGGSLKPMEID